MSGSYHHYMKKNWFDSSSRSRSNERPFSCDEESPSQDFSSQDKSGGIVSSGGTVAVSSPVCVTARNVFDCLIYGLID